MSIILDQVNKSYNGQPIVRNVSLEIEQGELFVLLGASGSGKSTLLRLIAGLTPLDSGRISLNGTDVTNLPPQQRGTGFVFQNYSLFRHMTVAQNIEFGLSIRRNTSKEKNKRVDELLTLIDLPNYGHRMPNELSGGQQQRVALARALAYTPNVLLLDEPFGALDVKIRAQLRANLREIQQRLGVTAILVTHDQEEAFEVADRIGVIDNGQLLEVGKPSDLYRRPQHRFTATFLGSANLLAARRNGSFVYLGERELPAPLATEHLANQAVKLMVRPEEITLSHDENTLDGKTLGRATVQEATFGGALQKVSLCLHTGETLTVLLTPQETRSLGIKAGTEVWVGLRDYHIMAE